MHGGLLLLLHTHVPLAHVWPTPQHVAAPPLPHGDSPLVVHRHVPAVPHFCPAGQVSTQVPPEHFWQARQQVAVPFVTLHGTFPLGQTQTPLLLTVVPVGQTHLPLPLHRNPAEQQVRPQVVVPLGQTH